MEKIVIYLLLFGLTVVCYLCGLWLRRRSGKGWLHPLLTSSIIIIVVLIVFDIPFETYEEANMPMNFLMDMSVVSLGWLLYDRISELKQALLPILVSSLVGSLVAMASVSLVFVFTDVPNEIVVSLIPKSVTAPIAVRLSEVQGGMVSVSAVSVFLTGILGAITGPFFLGLIGVDTPVARGLAMGCTSHAIGTSRAIEMGAVEGAISGLSIALMGILTAILYPLYCSIFY